MSQLEIGLVFSTFELTQFVFTPLYGTFLTRIGAKLMYVAGILVGGVCFILFGWDCNSYKYNAEMQRKPHRKKITARQIISIMQYHWSNKHSKWYHYYTWYDLLVPRLNLVCWVSWEVDLIELEIKKIVEKETYAQNAQNGFSLFLSFYLKKKTHTKLIYHMPWLYQYSQVPFHRSYKNWSAILKDYPPWLIDVLKWNVLISIVIVGKKYLKS